MINIILLAKSIREGVKIDSYCRKGDFSDVDSAALHLLNAQFTINPGKTLDEIFGTDELSDEDIEDANRVVNIYGSIHKNGEMVEASKLLLNNPEYRHRIFETYQSEISPWLHPKGQRAQNP